MADDLESSVGVQSDPSLSTPQAEAGATDNADTTSVQSQGQGDNADGQLGPSDLPPELEETKKNLLRDYHTKTQALRDRELRFENELETSKKEASTLRQLMTQPWFQKAMAQERAARSGQVDENSLSDEEFETVKNDKKAFLKLVSETANRIVSSQVAPVVSEQAGKLEDIALEREYNQVSGRFKDFQDLHDQGHLDEYLDKGYDFETAYKAYKFDHDMSSVDRRAQEEARRMLEESSAGAIAKGGQVRPSGTQIIEASNLDEAMDAAFELASKGKTNFEIRKPQHK